LVAAPADAVSSFESATATTPIYTLPYIADHADSFLHEHAPQAKGGIEQMALEWRELLEARGMQNKISCKYL
jgi:hypothetical protein